MPFLVLNLLLRSRAGYSTSLVLAVLLSFVLGCGGFSSSRKPAATPADESNSRLLSVGLGPRDSNGSQPRFRALESAITGIDLVHRFPSEAPIERMADQYSGSGVCIGDFDADGLPDVYFTNYDQGNRLYRNLGDFRFEDVTDSAGVDGEGRWCGGAVFVDLDNDADLDLCVCVFNAPNLVYTNQGNGVFKDEARLRGLDYSGASVMMSFADYDRDGDLDGYLVTHRMNVGDDFHMPRSTQDALDRAIIERTPGGKGVRVTNRFRELFQLMDRGEGRIELVIAGQQDYLYRNDGSGHFQVINEEAGISGYGIGLAASWWDYNDDGLVDLYVSNDYKGADQLYRNNADGTFHEVTRAALPHVPWFSMGSATADVNNDGRIDLLASDMSGTTHFRQKMAMGDMQKDQWFLKVSNPPQYMRNALYLNTGTRRVMEIAQLAGIANTDWSWSPLFGDLDNDGWVDLFVTNGMSRDFMDSDLRGLIKSKESTQWLDLPVRKERNLAFRNVGDLGFDDVSAAWGLDQLSASYGAALADMDRDGDLDLIVASFDEPVKVYRNNSVQNNALAVRLTGTANNRLGLGARVDVETSAGSRTRWINPTQGFMSAGEPIAHFGLGDDDRVLRLSVTWPNGTTQNFTDLDANRLYSITEDASRASPKARPMSEPTWFRQSGRLHALQHRETEYDDYRRQPLLPAKLSRQGPSLAVGDVDDDGVDDIFLSGAAGQTGQLFNKQARSPVTSIPAEDSASEQLGSLFFDCDGDGDRDLYVVSGSVESEPGHESLRDRLYVNDGSGRFTDETRDRLPIINDSGSCVATADFDRDGDLDLFVGGRVIPGQYPTSPPSRILRNAGGRFELDQKALVSSTVVERTTSAVWSDVNNDGWIDLLVTQQWGPVRYFQNDRGILRERTEASGLSSHTGWWNGIAGGDLDRDGDIDYVVTNQGLNTKYHASPEHPTLIYYGDFEGKGTRRVVEANFENDILYPERGRSCTTAAMPSLGSRFQTYSQFALASLEDIFSTVRLQKALRLEANTLESGILFNDGDGNFSFVALPRLAQVSPAFGVVVLDVNGDGNLDIFLVHNSFSPQPETGRMDGGMSLLLKGAGDGTFDPVWPKQSGLIVPGDAKSLSVIDVDDDGTPDALVGINHGHLMTFENQVASRDDFLTVRLRGGTNLDATGARVELTLDEQSKQIAEVYAGGGYLSQSSAALWFGLDGQRATSIRVRWPDGSSSQHEVPTGERNVVLWHAE